MVGPPGTVLQAIGTGFPPNSAITLTWSQGIGPAEIALTDGSGDFTQSILIFPRDRLGYRELMTSNPSLQAQFLVEFPSANPAGKDELLFKR